jgi:hypothetical protein
MGRPLLSWLLLASAIAATSCQRQAPLQFAPVEGTVTKGGKPLSGVVVVFWGDAEAGTAGPCSTGPTDVAGRYQLHTEQGETGAVVGRHRVCIVDAATLIGRLGRRPAARAGLHGELPAPAPSPVPPSYADKNETPLRADVWPGPQVIDLEVK